jgi:hypothetical protein
LRYAGFVAGREICTGTIRGFRWQGAGQAEAVLADTAIAN